MSRCVFVIQCAGSAIKTGYFDVVGTILFDPLNGEVQFFKNL